MSICARTTPGFRPQLPPLEESSRISPVIRSDFFFAELCWDFLFQKFSRRDSEITLGIPPGMLVAIPPGIFHVTPKDFCMGSSKNSLHFPGILLQVPSVVLPEIFQDSSLNTSCKFR